MRERAPYSSLDRLMTRSRVFFFPLSEIRLFTRARSWPSRVSEFMLARERWRRCIWGTAIQHLYVPHSSYSSRDHTIWIERHRSTHTIHTTPYPHNTPVSDNGDNSLHLLGRRIWGICTPQPETYLQEPPQLFYSSHENKSYVLRAQISYKKTMEFVKAEGIQGKVVVAMSDRMATWLYKVMTIKVCRW